MEGLYNFFWKVLNPDTTTGEDLDNKYLFPTIIGSTVNEYDENPAKLVSIEIFNHLQSSKIVEVPL